MLRTTLDNGLTVILQENRAAKVAALQLWVRVGSADELEDEAGLAHLHEHMLFKGTARRGPGEIARTVEGCGGDINAWTSYDQTVYHLVLASDFFREGLDILADAVTQSIFDPTELAREIEVVCEEIRRAEDMPSRRVSRELFASAFKVHPYKRPVIGYEQSVRSFTREKILAFYKRHYTAPNMVFVAVGDFDERQALEAVQEAFREASDAPPVERIARRCEPAQQETRVAFTTAPVREAYLSLGWHIPGVTGEDVAALDLLALLLGQGDSSRLTLEVKRERSLVNEIYASAYTPQDPGLLLVGSSLQSEKIPEAAAEILRQCYRLRREELSAEELARAKRMLESDTIYQRETVQGQARKLGFFATVAGGIDAEERYLAAVARATAADLRAAADRYLRSENLSVSILTPQGEAEQHGLGEARIVQLAQEAEAAVAAVRVTERPAAKYARLTHAAGKAERRQAGGVVREVLPNGVTLLVKPDRTVPLVSLRSAWVGGLRHETPEDNGINYLLARTLLRGTTTRNARDLAREIDELAGGVGGTSGRNSFGARGEFLSADLARGFALFSDVLLRPAFDPAEVDKERALVREEIRSRDDSPGSAVFSLFSQTLYDQHPYRLEVNGTEESLATFTPERLRQHHRDICRLDGMTMAVVGDVSVDEVRALALQHLVGGEPGRLAPPPVAAEPPLTGPREVRRKLDRKQAHLVLGFRGTTVTSPDRFALQVLSAILSGQGGRLFLELRDKRSMAYTVTSMLSEGLDPGYFAVYMGTSPEKVPAALAGIRDELERVRQEPVTPQELERARRHLVGSHEIGLQRLGARSAVLALDETYGLGAENHLQHAERIRQVTADDVLAVARRYIDFDRAVTALVSPEA